MIDLIDRIDSLYQKSAKGPWDMRYGPWQIWSEHRYIADFGHGWIDPLDGRCGNEANFVIALVNAWPEIRDRLKEIK